MLRYHHWAITYVVRNHMHGSGASVGYRMAQAVMIRVRQPRIPIHPSLSSRTMTSQPEEITALIKSFLAEGRLDCLDWALLNCHQLSLVTNLLYSLREILPLLSSIPLLLLCSVVPRNLTKSMISTRLFDSQEAITIRPQHMLVHVRDIPGPCRGLSIASCSVSEDLR